MKLRLNTLLVTALCLSAIDGLAEPILLTQGNPETDDLPDEVAQDILDSEHGHCLNVVEPKPDADTKKTGADSNADTGLSDAESKAAAADKKSDAAPKAVADADKAKAH